MTFDLGAGNPHLLQLLQMLGQGHIFQGEQRLVRRLSPAVVQAAGLGAHPPVAAAAADDGGEEALAGVAHTQRPVAEHLDLRAAAGADLPYLVPVQLPGQHHALHAQRRGRIGAAQREQAHLRAGVKRQVRHDLLCQGQQAPVLHQHRVHAHGAGLPQRRGRPGQTRTPRRWQYRTADANSSSVKFFALRRALNAPKPIYTASAPFCTAAVSASYPPAGAKSSIITGGYSGSGRSAASGAAPPPRS